MLARLRTVLAVFGAAVLLLQGTVAAASAVACMKACEQAKAVPACHRQKGAPKKECGGSCTYVCSADKAAATNPTVKALTLPTLEVPAVMPTATDLELTAPVVEPELFQTDSSPPESHSHRPCSLRAPPAQRA
jgi:hypothetical protein